MVIGDSTKKIGALSSEYSNTDYRPYVVVQYHADEITLEEGKTLQLNTGITGAVTWSSSDTSRASVSSTGLVTGIKAGGVTITATFGSNETTSFPVYVTVPSGVYYIKNASSGLCLQGTVGQIHINSQKSSQNTRIDQLRKITYLQNGQYVIRPMQNLSRALTVDSGGYVAAAAAAVADSAVTSAFRWSISYNEYGYSLQQNSASSKTITPVVSGMPDSAVYTGTWSDSPAYHWGFEGAYAISLNIYYDQAFNVRHSNAANLIEQFSVPINNIFIKALNLQVSLNNPLMITSTPDNCKLHRGLSLNTSTINAMCPANPSNEVPSCSYHAINLSNTSDNQICQDCTSWLQIYRDFIKQYPGTPLIPSVLFTGSKLYNENGIECNRSYKWYNNGVVLQNVASSTAEYFNDVISTFAHELSHIIGAPDHYHYLGDDNICDNKELCIQCTPSSGRSTWCIMDKGKIENYETHDYSMMYCEYCKNDILAYLQENLLLG